jgi:hypothetical protein
MFLEYLFFYEVQVRDLKEDQDLKKSITIPAPIKKYEKESFDVVLEVIYSFMYLFYISIYFILIFIDNLGSAKPTISVKKE